MLSKSILYWVAQISGWTGIVVISLLGAKELNPASFILGASAIVFGILLSHTYRLVIKKYNWARFSPIQLLPVNLVSSILLAVLFLGSQTIVAVLIGDHEPLTWVIILVAILNSGIIFFFWSAIYFSYHFFERSKSSEIKNIKLEASKQEAELQNLKMQLNPHFMFNAMNSIRALIDDEPKAAKNAVTKLSSLLRSTLIAGKKSFIPFSEEVQIVSDYLDLEKVRFEERLSYSFEIDKKLNSFSFPPLMLQGLVENAVKHGISNRREGGDVLVKAILKEDDILVTVTNTGNLARNVNEKTTAVGLENTKLRLKILYGARAHFKINELNDMVVASLTIPK